MLRIFYFLMGILAQKKAYNILGTVTTVLKKKDYKLSQAM